MIRLVSIFAAFIVSTLMIGSAAYAQPARTFYVAVPATAPAVGRAVARDILWTCDGSACAAGQGTSRPAVICQAASRELGALNSFRAGAETFDTAALEKCNARAR